MQAEQEARRAALAGLLAEHFPPVAHSFAYGSGVFAQPGLYSSAARDRPLLDFMLAVEDTAEWHRQNVERNRGHYSMLAWFGPSTIVANAERLGVGVHFNTGVTLPSQQVIKYGVVSTTALLRDLTIWDSLYGAGRLQKPVLHLCEDERVVAGVRANLASAVTVARLLLPGRFSLEELLLRVCKLSYLGDIRMGLAEDRQKVERIVEGSFAQLQSLYSPLLQQTADCVALSESPHSWLQETGQRVEERLLAALPQALLLRLAGRVGMPPEAAPNPTSLSAAYRQRLASAVWQSGQHRGLLEQSLAATVRASSRRQAVAGVLMAGGARSASYLWKKLQKAWASR